MQIASTLSRLHLQRGACPKISVNVSLEALLGNSYDGHTRAAYREHHGRVYSLTQWKPAASLTHRTYRSSVWTTHRWQLHAGTATSRVILNGMLKLDARGDQHSCLSCRFCSVEDVRRRKVDKGAYPSTCPLGSTAFSREQGTYRGPRMACQLLGRERGDTANVVGSFQEDRPALYVVERRFMNAIGALVPRGNKFFATSAERPFDEANAQHRGTSAA